MKYQWQAAIFIVASCVDSYRTPKKLIQGPLGKKRAHQEGLQAESDGRIQVPSEPIPMAAEGLGNTRAHSDGLREILQQFAWTMMIGDSVMASQFLTIAGELHAQSDEPALTHVAQCADQNGWPTASALLDFTNKPVEYLILCGPSSCSFSRLGCTVVSPGVAGGSQACPEQAWEQMVAGIEDVVSQPGHFAVSFHWAPDYLVNDQVQARMTNFLPGAVLFNNCHHWGGHTTTQNETIKLPFWKQYLESAAGEFEQLVAGGSVVAYQGCTKVRCVDTTNPFYHECQEANLWYENANTAAEHLMSRHNISFVDVHPLLPDSVVTAAFLDNQHPCMPVPCMWASDTQNPPRQCCVSMLMHSLQVMNSSRFVFPFPFR